MAISPGRTLVRCVVAFILVAILADWLVANIKVFHAGDTENLRLAASASSSAPSSVPEARIDSEGGVVSPVLTLDPKEGRPGTLINVTGKGYITCESNDSDGCFPVEVFWDLKEKVGTTVSNSNGHSL
jgi:hypothetical protein